MNWFQSVFFNFGVKRKKRKKINIDLTKRQRFVISVVILCLLLFVSESLFVKSGFFVAFGLSILTDLLLYWANYQDIRTNLTRPLFILPFLFSLAFALFYFLIPARFLTRILLTGLYGVGLYSMFLSQNIFTVASIRTIQLLSSAKTVSFFITVVCYLFLSTVVLSLHASVFLIAILVFLFTFLLTTHSLWTYTLDTALFSHWQWALGISLCLFEIAFVIWFWPSNPKLIAIFLTGFFYAMIGLSHMWIDKRLFKGVLWEYIWLMAIVFFTLLLFTPWAS